MPEGIIPPLTGIDIVMTMPLHFFYSLRIAIFIFLAHPFSGKKEKEEKTLEVTRQFILVYEYISFVDKHPSTTKRNFYFYVF